MQKGVTWWGPDFAVEFVIIVTAAKLPKVMYNVFQVSKVRASGIGPRQENIPGVWVIKSTNDQRIAIQISYIKEDFIYIDYEVGRKYHIEIIQAALDNNDYWPHWGGKKCVTWPKNNGYDVYVWVDKKLHAQKNVKDAELLGTQVSTSSLDYECPRDWEGCTKPDGWCECGWCSGGQCCPRCPRGPWKEVAIWASNPHEDSFFGSFTDEFGILENLVLYSQPEKPSYPCLRTCKEEGDPSCKYPGEERLLSLRNQSMILPSGNEISVFSSNMPEQHFANMSLVEYAKSLGVDFSHQIDLESPGPSTESQDIGNSETNTKPNTLWKLSNLRSYLNQLLHKDQA